MTLKEFRLVTANTAETTELCVRAFDNGLKKASVHITAGSKMGVDRFIEDMGEDIMPEIVFGKKVPVLLIE
jgi:hypothetical protein